MRHAPLLLALVCASAFAGSPDPADELAERSGLPASEVRALLSDCDASQTSMNFCAWRDQIAAEQALQRAIDRTAGASSSCKAELQEMVATWKKRRDASCRKSAETDWGSGSMLPTALATCATVETKRMTKAIGAKKCK